MSDDGPGTFHDAGAVASAVSAIRTTAGAVSDAAGTIASVPFDPAVAGRDYAGQGTTIGLGLGAAAAVCRSWSHASSVFADAVETAIRAAETVDRTTADEVANLGNTR